jgi:hypothetical protein
MQKMSRKSSSTFWGENWSLGLKKFVKSVPMANAPEFLTPFIMEIVKRRVVSTAESISDVLKGDNSLVATIEPIISDAMNHLACAFQGRTDVIVAACRGNASYAVERTEISAMLGVDDIVPAISSVIGATSRLYGSLFRTVLDKPLNVPLDLPDVGKQLDDIGALVNEKVMDMARTIDSLRDEMANVREMMDSIPADWTDDLSARDKRADTHQPLNDGSQEHSSVWPVRGPILRSKMANMTREISAMRQELAEAHRMIGKLRKEIEEMKAQDIALPVIPALQEVLPKIFPVLEEVYRNSKLIGTEATHRTWSPTALSMCYAVYGTSPAAYKLVRRIFPLPAVSTLLEVVGPRLKRERQCLTTPAGIPVLVRKWRKKHALDNDSVIDAILGCDAANFSPTRLPTGPVNHAYLFHVMPIRPDLVSLTARLMPHPSNSLGVTGKKFYDDICDILRQSNINILSYASDGDRGNLTDQGTLFEMYEKDVVGDKEISEICDKMFPIGHRAWWVADVLHVLKCQRCRLNEDLYFAPNGEAINAETLNRVLKLRHSLSNLTGIAKMNDVLAVQLFTFENLMKLIDAGELNGAYYLAPFVFWYGAISITNLSFELRLGMLRASFELFRNWYKSYKRSKSHLEGRFFALENDLKRYMNTVLFLFHLTRARQPIAFNHIGTHPIENLFGIIRVLSHFTHTWPRFLSCTVRSLVLDDIFTVNFMKSHVRREFGIAGIKILVQSSETWMVCSSDFPYWVQQFSEIMFTSKDEDDRDAILADLVETLRPIMEWCKKKHTTPVYYTEKVANETILNRLFGYTEKGKKFVWTKSKEARALKWYNNPNHTPEFIMSELHCTQQDLNDLLDKHGIRQTDTAQSGDTT